MINYDEITYDDCLEQYTYKNKAVLLNDGKVIGFIDEKIKTESLETA